MSDDEDDHDEEDSDEEEDEDGESDDESENLFDGAKKLDDLGDEVNIPERWTSELDELFSAIEFSNASLMRFSIVIRISPARDDYLKAAARYNYDNSFKIFYVNHVRDKHGAAMGDREWLIQRMGTAITRRKQYLTYRKEHQGKLSRDWDEEEHDVKPGGEREHTVALTLATDYEEKRKQDEVHEVEENEGSFGSVTSYENTVVGEASQKRTVPPPPPMAFEGIPFEYGEPFQCPYCYTEQIVQNKQAWKSHVFKDLKPYVCTFQECDLKMFKSRNEWFAHELQNHRREWSCILCGDTFANKTKFQTHLINIHKVDNESQLKAMVAQSEEPVDKILPSACLFCKNWEADLLHSRHDATRAFLGNGEKIKPAGSLGQFRRHLGHHLEQLALFALPINEGADVQDDSDNEDGSEKDSLDESKAEGDVMLKALAELKAVDSQDAGEELPLFDASLDTPGYTSEQVLMIDRSSNRSEAQYIDSSENLVKSPPGSPLESEGSVRGRTGLSVNGPIFNLQIPVDVTEEVSGDIAAARSTNAREAVDNFYTGSQPTEYISTPAAHVPIEHYKPAHNEEFERIRERLSQAAIDVEIEARNTQVFEGKEENEVGKIPDIIGSETSNESASTTDPGEKLSRAEREAAYEKARERIFGKRNESSELAEDSDDSTESTYKFPAASRTNLLIENPEDIRAERHRFPSGSGSRKQVTSPPSSQPLNLDSRQSLAYPGAKATLPAHYNYGYMQDHSGIGTPLGKKEWPKASQMRFKVSRACDECRRNKIKCDAADEERSISCSRCKRVNAICQFNGFPAVREPSKGYIKELATRVNQLEGEIQASQIPRGSQDKSTGSGMGVNPLDEGNRDVLKDSASDFLAPSSPESLQPYSPVLNSRAPIFDGASDLGSFEDGRGESGDSTPNYADDVQFNERLYLAAGPIDEPTMPVPVYEEVITHYRDFNHEAIPNSQQTTLDVNGGGGTPTMGEGTSHKTIVENNHPHSRVRQTVPDEKSDVTTPMTKGLSSMKRDKNDLFDKFFSDGADAGVGIKQFQSKEGRSGRHMAEGDDDSEILEQAVARQEEADRHLRLTGGGLISALASAHRLTETSLDRGEEGNREGNSVEGEISKPALPTPGSEPPSMGTAEKAEQSSMQPIDRMRDELEPEVLQREQEGLRLSQWSQEHDVEMDEVVRSGDTLRDPRVGSRNIPGDVKDDKGEGKTIEQDTAIGTKSPPPQACGGGVIKDKQSLCRAPGCENRALGKYSHCSNHVCSINDCDNLRPSGLTGPYCLDHIKVHMEEPNQQQAEKKKYEPIPNFSGQVRTMTELEEVGEIEERLRVEGVTNPTLQATRAVMEAFREDFELETGEGEKAAGSGAYPAGKETLKFGPGQAEAVKATSLNHDDLPTNYINDLLKVGRLGRRFERTGAIGDLNRAIGVADEALQAGFPTSDSDPPIAGQEIRRLNVQLNAMIREGKKHLSTIVQVGIQHDLSFRNGVTEKKLFHDATNPETIGPKTPPSNLPGKQRRSHYLSAEEDEEVLDARMRQSLLDAEMEAVKKLAEEKATWEKRLEEEKKTALIAYEEAQKAAAAAEASRKAAEEIAAWNKKVEEEKKAAIARLEQMKLEKKKAALIAYAEAQKAAAAAEADRKAAEEIEFGIRK